MDKNKQLDKTRQLLQEITTIIDQAKKLEKDYEQTLSKVQPNFLKSARNLIHYRALRMEDIRSLQKKLGNIGLSRLAKSESHVMASLLSNKSILKGFLKDSPVRIKHADLTFKKSNQLEKSNAKSLLGYRSKGRRTRIMVTLPSDLDYKMAQDMITNGMNCARINCAHDDTEVWAQMISHIRKASSKLKRTCKIMMDLGGPKIRTGALVPGPKVRKFRPKKNERGKIIEDCQIWMGPESLANSDIEHLPVLLEDIPALKKEDQLFLKDARHKKRTLVVESSHQLGYILKASKTTYVETGMHLFSNPDYSGAPIIVGEIPTIVQPIVLHTGSFLRLLKTNELGEPARFDKINKLLTPAHISCSAPAIFNRVKKGEPIFFDDGKIKGIIREVRKKEMLIEIVHAKQGGSKLRSDKGINLPSSDLKINGLTDKDKKDLEFVAQQADVVNLSFVNRAKDVQDLFKALKKCKARKELGVILKIETQSGFNNLTDILLEAMQKYPLGVMIARGDLAIECGWDNIARVQEEILLICHAAHVPAIWATQVLENLSKAGIPSRAEITDAAMAQRADCVMLNKGPYIIKAIQLLDTILKDMAPYQDKNAPLLPMMEKAVITKK